MKKILWVVLTTMHFFVFGQNPSVKGTVVDSKTQQPISFVTVSNGAKTVYTDNQGNFQLAISPGNYALNFTYAGYMPKKVPVTVEKNKVTDLGIILLQEEFATTEKQLSLITLTDNDLSDENSGSESTSGLLQASRDAYQQSAAFNWGQARFRVRGLDNEYGTTMINGVVMNKLYDGRPQWSNWGGLNDATRNQEFTMGSAASDYTFGGILGTQEINTRASIYRPGNRISYSGTNTNYSWRMMGTTASGLSKDGWAYVVSASRRWTNNGYFEGTTYDANSFFASVEKKISKNHSLNFTSIYAENQRGKSSPNTAEVTDLKNHQYNSYWGWQEGKKRNSREKNIEEPILMLSHYWKIGESSGIQTNIAYQFGSVGNSRLDYQLANNPDPTYYRNLPSYYLNTYNSAGVWTPDYTNATIAKQKFLADGQLDWAAMYDANTKTPNNNSAYVLYEDRTDDKQWTANIVGRFQITDNVIIRIGENFRKLKSHNFQNLMDLLGGRYFLDIDTFGKLDQQQSDLNNPDRKVYEGDTYGYNYNLYANVLNEFVQAEFSTKDIDGYVGATFMHSEYKREGLYKNGYYPTQSFGFGEKQVFNNYGAKAGVTYKLTAQHLFTANAVYMTKAPSLRNTYANARINNNVTPNLESETIMGTDINYIIRIPKLKGRIGGFYNTIKNSTELSFYYAESVNDDSDDTDAFVSEILTGLDKKYIGGEMGLEYQLTPTFEISVATSYGKYTYDSNPNVKLNDDSMATATNTFPVVDFGKAYLKNYNIPGTPQQAYSLGFEYRDPHYWFIGMNGNYLTGNYIDVSSIMRTNNFVMTPAGVPYEGTTNDNVQNALKQQRLEDIVLINLTAGKSWRVSNKNRNTIGFFASLNNITDHIYRTGGFEQSRKASYPDYSQDNAHNTPSFGSKYFYGYGRNYFVNFYFNF